MRHAEFRHPRMPELYDIACPWSVDDDFFMGVVADEPAPRIADLGCGTGRLAIALAAAARTVTGIDPAAASLDRARSKSGAEGVTWLLGTSSILPENAFDCLLMTSHAAQFLAAESEWRSALSDVHDALVAGGRVIFDSRDPADRGWEGWNPVDSVHQILGPDGAVDVWTEVTAVSDEADPLVSATHHYVFPDGFTLTSEMALRFRREATLRATLEQAGFEVEAIYGGWQREPIGHADGELLVVARAH